MLDSLGVEVFTIEMQLGKDLVKSDIMREPVAFKKIDPNKRLTPIEALASSLNFYGKVDMDYLMQSTDSAEEEIIGDLKGEIFYNPAIGGVGAQRQVPFRQCHSQMQGDRFLLIRTHGQGKKIGRKLL